MREEPSTRYLWWAIFLSCYSYLSNEGHLVMGKIGFLEHLCASFCTYLILKFHWECTDVDTLVGSEIFWDGPRYMTLPILAYLHKKVVIKYTNDNQSKRCIWELWPYTVSYSWMKQKDNMDKMNKWQTKVNQHYVSEVINTYICKYCFAGCTVFPSKYGDCQHHCLIKAGVIAGEI